MKPRGSATSIFCVIVVLVLLGMGGCASTGGVKPGGTALASEKPDCAWWYARFQMNWPQDTDPSMDTDVLIAHAIIKPVLDRFKNDISLWRFHRRAARDATGHQFSFIFYTSPSVARRIYAAIDSSAVLDRMKAEGVIVHVFYDDTNKLERRGLGGTSDRAWSVPLQKAWPYFIMGVSETWLALASNYADQKRKEPLVPAEMREFYRQINEEIETTWNKEGGHAFLHHLNALFGYGPVKLRGNKEMQF